VEGWKVLDKALMAVPDLEMRSLAAAEPNRDPTLDILPCSAETKLSSPSAAPRDRTALQMLIKAFLASSWPGGPAS
jgi:hypothetical protein